MSSADNGGQSSPETGIQPSPATWHVYLVRATNGALYCGITTDPQRRLQQHREGRGARFFNSSPALGMVYLESCPDKGSALRREHAIKRMSKQQKERLVSAVTPPPCLAW